MYILDLPGYVTTDDVKSNETREVQEGPNKVTVRTDDSQENVDETPSTLSKRFRSRNMKIFGNDTRTKLLALLLIGVGPGSIVSHDGLKMI
jgi:hypothetical protein